MENKDWTPTIDKIVKIADYLGYSIDYLAGRTEFPTLLTFQKNDKCAKSYELLIEQLQSEIDEKNRIINVIRSEIIK